MAERSGFLAELKRRHVWRIAIAYVVTAWLLLQLASIILPTFGTPAWVLKALIVIFVILFPIALILAWAFEITPEGVRRTVPAQSGTARDTQATRAMGRKLNHGIMVALVLAVALLLGNQMFWHKGIPDNAVATRAPAAASAIAAKSIAVLPFENLSSDRQNAYFVAGMQDLILTKLADIGDLKVISRTSTMSYGSHPQNLTVVGSQLGVATILEGSVQKLGNQVLINVQLINAVTDDHIWAESYTRTLDNVFGVEGEVAGKIAEALNAKLSPAQSAQLAAVPTTNKAAYDAFLRAEYQANKGEINYATENMKAAIPLYQEAVRQDPDFALAWARLSYEQSQLAWFGGGGKDVKHLNAQARLNAEHALQLQPDLAAAQLALGYNAYWGRGDYAAALRHFAAALKLTPNDADALVAQAFVERRQGRYDDAIASLQRALALDPRNSASAYELGRTYMGASRYPDAGNAFQRALALDPDNRIAKIWYAYTIELDTGDIPRALAVVQGDDPLVKLLRVRLLTEERKYLAALALLKGIPDTPDIFSFNFGSKARQEADLYRLLGDTARARSLYAQALPQARAQLAIQRGINLATVWQNIAHARLGLGDISEGLAAVGKADAIAHQIPDQIYGPRNMVASARLYALARHADLAVPLLTKALASPGIGAYYSPVLLWLEPQWDPIRKDPRFEALLKQYAKYKPAVTYPATARSPRGTSG